MIYNSLSTNVKDGTKKLSILLDPDKLNQSSLLLTIEKCVLADVDYLFVGGSLLMSDQLDSFVRLIKEHCNIPVILFPGSPLQISKYADGILFLSLISGRNPELLIGSHVVAAPLIKRFNIEVIPTGYLLIDGGKPTSVSYMSNTTPIPADKPDVAVCTAMAGEMLGLQTIYMDSGSGASLPVPNEMLDQVRQNVNVPIIVGGGIDSAEKAENICSNGATVVVVGNAVEKDISLIEDIASAVKSVSNATYRNI